jgi:hypothetical protein
VRVGARPVGSPLPQLMGTTVVQQGLRLQSRSQRSTSRR